jgi:hypothetical protein
LPPIKESFQVVFINRPPTEAEIKKHRIKKVTHAQRERMFRSHALVLGRLVLSWSDLHQELARLFYAVVGGSDPGVALAVWNSSRSDRSQREMLRGAAAAALSSGLFRRAAKTSHNPRAYDDVDWLLNQCDTLASRRNDAIHAPFLLEITDDNKTLLRPSYKWGNNLAVRLHQKTPGDLSVHFNWVRECIDIVTRFAYDTCNALLWPDFFAWPDRPRLPAKNQTSKAKRARRHPPGKEQPF